MSVMDGTFTGPQCERTGCESNRFRWLSFDGEPYARCLACGASYDESEIKDMTAAMDDSEESSSAGEAA